ncbi:TPA: HAD family hydrolase, partial [Streptococcus pyogenes]
LVIGDRLIDKQAGQAAGFNTLLVDGRKNLLEIVT